MNREVTGVPLSQTLDCGTVGQQQNRCADGRDRPELPSLKSLAEHVLRRTADCGTRPVRSADSCPTAVSAVGQMRSAGTAYASIERRVVELAKSAPGSFTTWIMGM